MSGQPWCKHCDRKIAWMNGKWTHIKASWFQAQHKPEVEWRVE